MEGLFNQVMTQLSVVVPVYNESSLIHELIKRVSLNVKKITENYEIIIVNDGSTDSTWSLIAEQAKFDKNLKALDFSRNFGHHYAITAGLVESAGDWVVVMDGDLQDRPEVIPDLFNKAQEGYDVVFVSRQNRKENIFYRLSQRFFYILLRILSGVNFDSKQANFSIISRKVVNAFKDFPETARFYGSTIHWLGFNRTTIFAEHGQRHSGKPSYTLKKRFKLAGDIIISFSERPLRASIYLGSAISLISILFAFWLIISNFYWGYSVIGWPSLMVSIFFLGGVILTILGIMGVYIGRIFQEVKNRPLFVISNKINFK